MENPAQCNLLMNRERLSEVKIIIQFFFFFNITLWFLFYIHVNVKEAQNIGVLLAGDFRWFWAHIALFC